MNLYPYNTGHLMIVPNAHVASPEEPDPEVMRGDGRVARHRCCAHFAARCRPMGSISDSTSGRRPAPGVADHLHEHVVPRWQGDANFMPILASTMVMPELIPVTYAKIRAELAAELASGSQVTTLVIGDDRARILVDAAGRVAGGRPPRG